MKKIKSINEHLSSLTLTALMDEYHHWLRGHNISCYGKHSRIANAYVLALGRRLRLSGPEARAFAQLFKLCSWDGSASKTDLATHWNNDLTGAGALFQALSQLELKGLVISKHGFGGKVNYSIPQQVAKSIYLNESPDTGMSNLDDFGMADRIQQLIHRTENENLNGDDIHHMIGHLLDRNPQLKISQQLKSWELATDEALLISYLYAFTLLDDGALNTDMAVNRLLGHGGRAKSLSIRLRNQSGRLFDMGIIRHANEEFDTGTHIAFSEDALSKLYEQSSVAKQKNAPVNSIHMPMIKASSIVRKELFYNAREESELNLLQKSLQPEAFKRIAAEMKSAGHTDGINILLYGPPGTGKTQAVLELARATGRDILKVDIATLRDKYVGESEKQVKRVFDSYKQHFESSAIAPILLMNECDGIISSRTAMINQSSDQMHNAMQNIFLEEMESFSGILLATTNFESKLDPAFERRFLHKIKIDLPDAASRYKIMQHSFAFLDAEALEALSSKYELSGAQVENISRKVLTYKLLNGGLPSLEYIDNCFDAEKWGDKKTRTAPGFTWNEK
jgi:hypothetical protein